MPITWNDTMSVGIPEIDAQHKQFLVTLNNLYEQSTKGVTKEDVMKAIDDLIDYAKVHFATEERYFDKYSYPGAEEHKKEHRRLLAAVEEYKDDDMSNPVTKSFEIIDFLEDWLVKHLEGMDHEYAVYFRERGITSL